jgi:hypothetical protein
VGDVGEFYTGTVRFRNGEEVVVFARKKGSDHEVVCGDQGKVLITEDRTSGVKNVHRDMRLEDFRSEVRSYAQATRSGEKEQ